MIQHGRGLSVIAALVAAALWAAPLGAGDGAEPVRYDDQTMNEPRKVHHVTPTYPKEAKEEGVQGVVILDAVIAEDGSVRETRVVKGEDARLVGAAQTAVGQWRYEPVLDKDGQPIAVLFTVTIRFVLSDK
jgi:TonB family protein